MTTDITMSNSLADLAGRIDATQYALRLAAMEGHA